MAKPRITSIGFVASATLAACFGAGPNPKPPSEAVVVLALPAPQGADRCDGSAQYVGDVALGSDTGYAALLPFTVESDCNGNNGMTMIEGPVSIESFALSGGTQQMVADLGQAQADGNQRWPKLAVTANGPFWLYADPQGDLQLGSPGTSTPLGEMAQMPIAFAANVNTWVAFGSTTGMGAQPADPDDPRYPCCGGQNEQPFAGSAALLDISGGSASVSALHGLASETYPVENALAVDGNGNPYYFAESQGGVQLASADGGTTSVPVDVSSLAPAGLAFDAAANAIVWSMAPRVQQTASSNDKGCEIWRYDLGSATSASILSTTSFSCLDVAAGEDGSVYFAIIDADGTDSDHAIVRGDGIGRVASDGSLVESLAMHVSGVAVGPRHVHVQAGRIYVVDPFTVASVDEHALDDRHDFAP